MIFGKSLIMKQECKVGDMDISPTGKALIDRIGLDEAKSIVEQYNNPISDFDILLAEIRECRIRTQNSDVVSMLDYLEHFAIGLKE